jgi:hypothetical protein
VTSKTISFLKAQMFYCPERRKRVQRVWVSILENSALNSKFETFMIQFFEQNHKSSRARDRNWGTQCRCPSFRGREWLTNGPVGEASGQCFSANM